MKNEFKPYLQKSIELGRSFIVSKYQRQRWPLFLLWQGITIFMDHFKDVKYMIGPVSMSDQYQKLSKELMIQFLLEEYGDKNLAKIVRPRNKVMMNTILNRILIQYCESSLVNTGLISESAILSLQKHFFHLHFHNLNHLFFSLCNCSLFWKKVYSQREEATHSRK
jgi:hypothetical protein